CRQGLRQGHRVHRWRADAATVAARRLISPKAEGEAPMRRLTGLAFAAAMLAAAAMQAGPAMLAPPAAAAEMSPLQVEARDAIRAWIGAVASGDTAKLATLLAPEFQIARADGSVYDRAGYLASQLPIIAEVPEV